MIRRIYIDNFRCLVNFELELSPITLLLGPNGSGKSTVFEVILKLQQLLCEQARVDQLFDPRLRTRWNKDRTQTFEMEIEGNSGVYRYRLVIEHAPDLRKMRIKEETLQFDQRPLFEFHDGMAKLYHDDHMPGPEYPFDWLHSGLAMLNPRPDNKKLTWFKSEVGRFLIAAFLPPLMDAEAVMEAKTLDRNAQNFSSWYRYISQEHQGKVVDLVTRLREIIPAFRALRLQQAGPETRVLQAGFAAPDEPNREEYYGFDELSDGQRVMVALYSLLYALRGLGYTLFLDEPENYLALREIQPWLSELEDAVGNGGITQAVLISHHPEHINYYGLSSGLWIERDSNGQARVKGKLAAGESGLSLADAIARGWNNG